MAQVIMSDKEYLEMMEKCKEFDELQQQMVDAFEINIVIEEIDPSKYTMKYTPVYPATAKEAIVDKVIKTLISNEGIMDFLFENKRYVLNLSGPYLSSWYEHSNTNLVRLTDYPEFKEAWNKALDRSINKDAEEEEEENV